MADRTIVVLGGGTGGLVVARRLRRSLDAADRVVLVDRSPTYQFAPSFLWVMSGARRAEQVSTDRRRLRRLGIDVLEGGRLAVVVSRLPYKCPAAPYETAFLAEALLRQRGVRNRTTIDIYTPEPYPMPTAGPVLGNALAGMLAERGITLHPERSIEGIDPAARELVLTDGERAGYDLLLGVPPHSAPEVLRASGLAAESGFVPVDRDSLATTAEGVYAIGDATAIPIAGGKFLPKAGVFAEAEADIVATNITAEMAGRTPTARFDGKGACFVELGDGRAAFASGDFYAADAPSIRLHQPGRHWHLAKVAFEKYWMRRWA